MVWCSEGPFNSLSRLRPGHKFQNGVRVEVGLRSEVKILDVWLQVLVGMCSAHRKMMGLIYQINLGKAKQFILKENWKVEGE